MTLQQKQTIFAINVTKLINYIHATSAKSVTLGECFRTSEQAELYAKSGKGIADSLHCKRLAIDINLFDLHTSKYLTDKSDYEDAGIYWKTLNSANRWGGDFVTLYHGKIDDPNHFEMQDL